MKKTTLSYWTMLLPLLLPSHSQGAPPDSPTVQKAEAEPDRYIGSSADWIKLRKEHEGEADNSHLRAQHLEARQLAKGAPGIRRKGKSLFLKTRDGEELHLDDIPAEDCTVDQLKLKTMASTATT